MVSRVVDRSQREDDFNGKKKKKNVKSSTLANAASLKLSIICVSKLDIYNCRVSSLPIYFMIRLDYPMKEDTHQKSHLLDPVVER